VRFQFLCCTETLCAVTANIRLHTFMSTYMFVKITIIKELVPTNVTVTKYFHCMTSAEEPDLYFWLEQSEQMIASQFISTFLKVASYVTFMFETTITQTAVKLSVV